MGEQGFFHFAGVDVGATADHQVLGTVEQAQVAVGIQATHITGLQPPVANRFGGGLGVTPITGHDQLAAHTNLTHLAHGQFGTRLVANPHLDHGLCVAHRGQAFTPAWVVGVQHIALGQDADGHGAFALTVNLRKVGPDDLQSLFDVRQIHGAAAINDGGQALRPLGQVACRVHQPPHHGGRCKK